MIALSPLVLASPAVGRERLVRIGERHDVSSAPRHLCSSGTPSSVAGSGPLTWSCYGSIFNIFRFSFNSTTASCSASCLRHPSHPRWQFRQPDSIPSASLDRTWSSTNATYAPPRAAGRGRKLQRHPCGIADKTATYTLTCTGPAARPRQYDGGGVCTDTNTDTDTDTDTNTNTNTNTTPTPTPTPGPVSGNCASSWAVQLSSVKPLTLKILESRAAPAISTPSLGSIACHRQCLISAKTCTTHGPDATADLQWDEDCYAAQRYNDLQRPAS